VVHRKELELMFFVLFYDCRGGEVVGMKLYPDLSNLLDGVQTEGQDEIGEISG
jgi:hypothetical protein